MVVEVATRVLTSEDFRAYRDLRLHMLREAPTAFGSDYESTLTQPDTHFIERTHNDPESFIVGGFAADKLVATAGGLRETQQKRRHISMIWGMYVHPEHRGLGLAGRLLTEVIRRLRALDGLEQIQLSVTAGNKPALALYEHAGFTTYGREPNALKVDGANYDELHMCLGVS